MRRRFPTGIRDKYGAMQRETLCGKVARVLINLGFQFNSFLFTPFSHFWIFNGLTNLVWTLLVDYHYIAKYFKVPIIYYEIQTVKLKDIRLAAIVFCRIRDEIVSRVLIYEIYHLFHG